MSISNVERQKCHVQVNLRPVRIVIEFPLWFYDWHLTGPRQHISLHKYFGLFRIKPERTSLYKQVRTNAASKRKVT